MVGPRTHALASFIQHHQEQAKHTVDGIAGIITVGALMDYLPQVSAFLSIVWIGIRIYETETVQKFFKKKKPTNE
jgi:hypothetical protein